MATTTATPMANRSARAIEPSDLRRLIDALDIWASHSPIGLRISALVQLAHGSALELNEALGLKMRVALNAGGYSFPRKLMIDGAQAVVPPQCHEPLQKWVIWSARHVELKQTAPLFFSPLEEGKPLEAFSARTAQDHFAEAQARARLAARYRFADLRHDALIRFAQRTPSPALTAQFGRLRDQESAFRFMPPPTAATLSELEKLAARPRA